MPARRFVMCPPVDFGVRYAINPWMDPHRPVDAAGALAEWEAVRATYLRLGHRVDEIPGMPGLPDSVFVANAAFVCGGRALVSRFRVPERTGEEAAYLEWFRAAGFETAHATEWNEGEGDLRLVGDVILAAAGLRTDLRAHAEVARFFDREVVSLTLVDPRWYHLDTALAVLDDHTVAWFPGAFDEASRQVLRARYPDAIVVAEADALAFGLNACSDGCHVVLPSGAPGFAEALAERGFEPVPVTTGELLKAGGSVKCCTLEIHP